MVSSHFDFGNKEKFGLKPAAPAMTELTGKLVPIEGRGNAIREEVQKEMGRLNAEWEFRLQLCRDLEQQPVENPTVEWDEERAPFAKVGTVRVRAQDSRDSALVDRVEEHSRFSIWTGIPAPRPLNNVNRARKETYRHSADFRVRTNACPYHEPAGTEN